MLLKAFYPLFWGRFRRYIFSASFKNPNYHYLDEI